MMRIFNLFFLLFIATATIAQNPFVMDRFTADPSARVFEGRVYVYPSHDIRKDTGFFATWFCMEDYHIYSSENLTEWTDHGMFLHQRDVPWIDTTTFSMWAPDCIEKDGKYYFYFPSTAIDKSEGRGRRVGVAVADSPTGPFVPQPEPMKGVFGIDPNPFIDRDGQAYLYWGGGEKLYMAKLKANMLELETEPQVVMELPPKFKEGPYVFERNGIYYFTFPHVPKTTERLVYAIGDNPMGPFEFKGLIMAESPIGCWTNHHSIIEYNEQWYLFYHHNDLSPNFDKNRSIRVDSLFFNADGTIQEVIPTLRGVGISKATTEIQLDRYSALSEKGASIDFIDSTNTKLGWKTILSDKDSWVRYNKVDLKNENLSTLIARLKADESGMLELRLNALDGPVVAQLNTTKTQGWNGITVSLEKFPAGIHDLFLISKSTSSVEIDWVKFE
jgi:hypothetical protein